MNHGSEDQWPPGRVHGRSIPPVGRVELEDGRTLGIPLAWYPRLLHGTSEQRAHVSISPNDLHWEELDEDISITGLLAGRGDMTRTNKRAA